MKCVECDYPSSCAGLSVKSDGFVVPCVKSGFSSGVWCVKRNYPWKRCRLKLIILY